MKLYKIEGHRLNEAFWYDRYCKNVVSALFWLIVYRIKFKEINLYVREVINAKEREKEDVER